MHAVAATESTEKSTASRESVIRARLGISVYGASGFYDTHD